MDGVVQRSIAAEAERVTGWIEVDAERVTVGLTRLDLVLLAPIASTAGSASSMSSIVTSRWSCCGRSDVGQVRGRILVCLLERRAVAGLGLEHDPAACVGRDLAADEQTVELGQGGRVGAVDHDRAQAGDAGHGHSYELGLAQVVDRRAAGRGHPRGLVVLPVVDAGHACMLAQARWARARAGEDGESATGRAASSILGRLSGRRGAPSCARLALRLPARLVGMAFESDAQRSKRRRQRRLFDAVAALYGSTRQGYPDEIIEAAVEAIALAPGDRVLEVGCGTGQLTVSLARLDLDLTAIDLGSDMVALARERVGDAGSVRFEVTAFEDLEADPGSFRVIASATAFHWVDPDVGWPKVTELLQPDGFLVLLGTAELYADPFGAALRKAWIDHSDDGGAWAATPQPTLSQRLVASGLFASSVVRSHHEKRTMTPDAVFDLEQTRATVLGYREDVRASFNDRLSALLSDQGDVPLTQESTLHVLQRADATERALQNPALA